MLFISGGAEEALAEQVSLPEAFAFLTKPFTTDTLLRRIRVLLDR